MFRLAASCGINIKDPNPSIYLLQRTLLAWLYMYVSPIYCQHVFKRLFLNQWRVGSYTNYRTIQIVLFLRILFLISKLLEVIILDRPQTATRF